MARKTPKVPDKQFDVKAFEETKELVKATKEDHQDLHKMYKKIEAAFFLRDEQLDVLRKSAKQAGDIKMTLHPWGRVSTLGAARLLSATEPEWKVPPEINSSISSDQSNKIEKLAKALWYTSGRVSGTPNQYDAALSCLLYSEIDILLVDTNKLLKDLPADASRAQKYRYNRIMKRTPILFQVLNPTQGWKIRDEFGPIAYYKETEVTTQTLLGKFSADELEKYGIDAKRLRDVHTFKRYWDQVKEEIWIGGHDDKPLRQGEHNFPTFPVVCLIGEGSALFDTPEKQQQPFLYTYVESGLWSRHNLMLTRMFSNLYAQAMNPGLLYSKLDESREVPEVSTQFVGGITEILKGESLEPMKYEAISNELAMMWEITNELSTESTIFKQALGEPLGANAPFSMVALLAQAGRLPLVTVQRQCNWAISTAMENAMEWLRKSGRSSETIEAGWTAEHSTKIKVGDIPEYVTIQGKMEIDLPQDSKSNADVALQLKTVGLASDEYVRDKFLKISDSDAMDNQIFAEQMMATMAEVFGQNIATEMSMTDPDGNLKPEVVQQLIMQYMEQQGQGQPGQMPPGGPPQGSPEQMPPTGMEEPPMPPGPPPEGGPPMQGAPPGPGAMPAPMSEPGPLPPEQEPQV